MRVASLFLDEAGLYYKKKQKSPIYGISARKYLNVGIKKEPQSKD